MQYRISGTVRNDSGAPVAGARVEVQSLTSSTPGTYFTYLSTRTDQTGRYTLAFFSVPGALSGPETVRENLAAFVSVWPDGSMGLNGDFQYVNAVTSEISKDFTLRRITRLTAGEDATVTIQPDSPICVNHAQDFHPWPDEWVCANVQIVAPVSGRLIVTATSTNSSGPAAQLVSPDPFIHGMSQIDYQVHAGEQVIVSVELPWPSSSLPQSFVVTSAVR